jgi:hypothetical protein
MIKKTTISLEDNTTIPAATAPSTGTTTADATNGDSTKADMPPQSHNTPQPDYYNSGSTQVATETPLTINRLEAVSDFTTTGPGMKLVQATHAPPFSCLSHR